MILFLVVVFASLTSIVTQPNFVFVLTDDQDLVLNSLISMKNTLRLVANKGVTFQNAFVNTPICCPSRSAILTGKYVHKIGVFNNSLSGNCSSRSWQRNHEKSSIANLLKTDKNYATFYAGKYLNQYGNKNSGGLGHVPAGYDWWIGLEGNSKYYNYSLSINGTKRKFTDEYLTDVISDYAIDFLNQKSVTTNPFFMMIAPPACHSPFTPAKRHVDKFKGTRALRTPNFNYTSNDKHWLIEMNPKHLPDDVSVLDQIYQRRLETLMSVDELVKRLIDKLNELAILNETYVIFTSDNGFHIGQFTQPWDKRQPYETDVRIPLLIRGPKIRKKSTQIEPISTIDFLPTILDLASIEVPPDVDGKSFKKHLFRSSKITKKSKNQRVFHEYFGEKSPKSVDNDCPLNPEGLSQCTKENWCKCQDASNNTYVCVRIIGEFEHFKYCQFRDDAGFIEAYDLLLDPYELENIRYKLSSNRISYYKRVLNKFKSS